MADLRNEMEVLSTDIFKATGQKVEFDDPIVIAALFQSRLLKQGYLDGVAALEAKAIEILGDARAHSESEKEKLKIFRDSQNLAMRQSSDTVRSLIKAELPKIRKEFYETATEVLTEIDLSVYAKKTKFYAASVIAVAIISFVLGVLIGTGTLFHSHSCAEAGTVNLPNIGQNR
ncbi:hypothetical protein UNDKW_5922 (plasmid) [Undibacterium sp. KW1]|nr:hypothetical protein UNDKW_5922 [Undibacterium sp. KW1]